MKLEKPLLSYFPAPHTPREHQIFALQQIEEAINSGTKFIIIQAPTGSGKSFFSKTLSNTTNKADPEYEKLINNYQAYDKDFPPVFNRFANHGLFALTTTKALQDQYGDLFDDSTIFKGKSNYQCEIDDSFTVDQAPCVISPNLKKSCWNTCICPYYEMRNEAVIDRFTVLNYASFFNLPNHIKKRQIIVCDEASEVEDEIVKNFSVVVNYKSLAYLDVKVEKLASEAQPKVLGWLLDVQEAVEDKIESFNERARFEKNKVELAKQRQRKDLCDAIKHTINHWDDAQYIVEKDVEKVIVTPLKIDRLTHCLFDYAEVVILMSATIVDRDIFAKNLGIVDYKYIEVPSTFDPKKSPIVLGNKLPLNHALLEKNLPGVIAEAVKIANYHKDEKGIIHTHTFKITQELQRKLNGKRYLYREEGTTNETIVKEHYLRTDATVIVSPSLTMGLDLKGDLGKWQIIIKLPYLPLGNKRIKMLQEKDSNWYRMKMLITLIQAAGRCTRTKEDESCTYILDGLASKIIDDCRDKLPKHFLDRIYRDT
jgi:ATP-dependent DNA helicase DinG